MSRPEHLRCIMTPEIIRSINRDQEYYDQDPDRYEREQREQDERQQQEVEDLARQEREWYNNQNPEL